MVLDKTGTVTEGRMTVTDIEGVPGVERAALLRWAGALEQASEHLVARAIAAAAEAGAGQPASGRPLPWPSPGSAPGEWSTVMRSLSGRRPSSPTDRSPFLPRPGCPLCGVGSGSGRTAVLVGRDDAVVGAVAIADTIRPSAAAAVRELQALGLHCVLLTGDNEPTARAVGAAIGVADVVADALPAEKVAVIRRLQSEGRSVAMVGDGVNDGPALASADLGLAVGSGTDVAINAADLIIVRDDLRIVATAVTLGPTHLEDDPGQPRLGVRLQRGGHPSGGVRASQSPDRCGRHGAFIGICSLE